MVLIEGSKIMSKNVRRANPKKKKVKKKSYEAFKDLGYISVDSGLIQIGDPCYDSEDQNLTRDWGKFCDQLTPALKKNDGVTSMGGEGRNLIFSTKHGDGCYPVFGAYNKEGRLESIIIAMDIYDFDKD